MVKAQSNRHGQRGQFDDVHDNERHANLDCGFNREFAGTLVERNAEKCGQQDRSALAARLGPERLVTLALRSHVTRGVAASSAGYAPAVVLGDANGACRGDTSQP